MGQQRHNDAFGFHMQPLKDAAPELRHRKGLFPVIMAAKVKMICHGKRTSPVTSPHTIRSLASKI